MMCWGGLTDALVPEDHRWHSHSGEDCRMATLEIQSPDARTEEQWVKPAARLRDLRGATVGLYWNMKAGGDAALDRTEALLSARFPGITFRRYTGSVGWLMRHCTAEDADRIASEVHAVVGTTND